MGIVDKRIKFTQMFGELIDFAAEVGINVIVDYVLRTAAEQKRLFDNGFSKCDGIRKKSQHQRALAVDLYIVEGGAISDNKERYRQLHDRWEIFGGEPMIEWDIGHFEVR